MALRWYTVVIDCHDIAAQARWWAETLDFQIVYEDEHEVAVIPKHMSEDVIEDGATWMRQAQGLVFVPVAEGKTVKNRLHIDLAPHTSQDRDAEIAALLERGATLADVGQDGRHLDGPGRPGGQRVLRAVQPRPLTRPARRHQKDCVRQQAARASSRSLAMSSGLVVEP